MIPTYAEAAADIAVRTHEQIAAGVVDWAELDSYAAGPVVASLETALGLFARARVLYAAHDDYVASGRTDSPCFILAERIMGRAIEDARRPHWDNRLHQHGRSGEALH